MVRETLCNGRCIGHAEYDVQRGTVLVIDYCDPSADHSIGHAPVGTCYSDHAERHPDEGELRLLRGIEMTTALDYPLYGPKFCGRYTNRCRHSGIAGRFGCDPCSFCGRAIAEGEPTFFNCYVDIYCADCVSEES